MLHKKHMTAESGDRATEEVCMIFPILPSFERGRRTIPKPTLRQAHKKAAKRQSIAMEAGGANRCKAPYRRFCASKALRSCAQRRRKFRIWNGPGSSPGQRVHNIRNKLAAILALRAG